MDKKIKVIINDVEMEVSVSEEELAKLTNKEEKKTGYERVKDMYRYYLVNDRSEVVIQDEGHYVSDDIHFESANYYSDKTLAENNARADRLMRQLRRFVAENCEELPWDNEFAHWFIAYSSAKDFFFVDAWHDTKVPGMIYFDTLKNAQKAIDTFKDELTWYLTEYRDRV